MSISPVCRRRTTFISCCPSDYIDCISRLNFNLYHILQWSLRNGLSINATKSQVMVVNQSYRLFLLDGNTIDFHQKVKKKLELIMNSKLTWDDQIWKICRNFFFTLKELWPMSQLTPSSHSSCIVMLFFPSPQQNCLNA
jgi:hypothetical protein